MLTVRQLGKAYAMHVVLDDVSFSLTHGEHVGLVGANGAGKSTLLRIIAGEESPDAGTVSLLARTRCGYLPQRVQVDGEATILQLVQQQVGDLEALEATMRELEQRMTDSDPDEVERAMEEYAIVSTQFEQRGGYTLEHRIETVLHGLGLAHIALDRRVTTLSGGERARIGLAVLLLQAPELLILDEPTSHLDAASLGWLEEYLKAYAGAILLVSHDRLFLNRTVSAILELDEHTHGVARYGGDYDFYRLEKSRERQRHEDAYERQQAEIKELRAATRDKARKVANGRGPRDSDKVAYNNRGASVERAVARNVRNAEERLERLEAARISRPPKLLRVVTHFEQDALRSADALRLGHVAKRYGSREVLHDVSLNIGPRSRILVTGPNGAGKSTLLRIAAGVEAPDDGVRAVAPGAVLGYLAQDPPNVPRGVNVLDAFGKDLPTGADTLRGILLRYGLLREEDLHKAADDLSVGQRRKAELARLIVQQPNVLLLDEPTNHLAFDVLEALEDAILAFAGAVVAVSHDRRFAEHFAAERLLLQDGSITPTKGSG